VTTVTSEIAIAAPADVVFGFVADQRNEPAYNPHIGAIREGHTRADRV